MATDLETSIDRWADSAPPSLTFMEPATDWGDLPPTMPPHLLKSVTNVQQRTVTK